jgi:hypothetical protein
MSSVQSLNFDIWWEEYARGESGYFGLSKEQAAFIYHSGYDDAVNNIKKRFIENCAFEEANT